MTRRTWSGHKGAALLAAGLALATLTPGPSMAQDVFGSLSRLFGAPHDERYPAQPGRSEPMAYANPSEVPSTGSPLPLAPSSAPSMRSTYCVRLCDGRFFPLSGPAASSTAAATRMCSAMCPASKTAIYRGGKIDDAAANNGDRYADLANAFVYREKLVADCTCNGKDALGLAPVDVASDPTLRPGDVVATAAGLKVFKGSKGETHKTADFTPIGNTATISADVRRKLATIRVAPAQ